MKSNMCHRRPINNSGYFRPLRQKEGVVVAGTWVWYADAGQTDFASVRGEGAGYWINDSHTDLNEYKWENIFLTKGRYKIRIIHTKALNRGIAEILFGTTSLGTKDCYNAIQIFNQVWDITFTLTNDITADMRFRVNGKNAASSDHLIEMSRAHIEKIG